MVATPVKKTFFAGAASAPQFIGTIISSTEGQGDRGRYWQLVVENEKTGQPEKMSAISDVDPDSMAYYRSNKYKMVKALVAAGVTDIEDRNLEDFEGLRFRFTIEVKENTGGFRPTTLFMPQEMLEP